jgi:hypothetical protein
LRGSGVSALCCITRVLQSQRLAGEEQDRLNTLLVYLDQDELVLVTLQPDFASRDLTGTIRRTAYVDRRLQSFPHLRAGDLPPDAVTLDIRPARGDCRYVAVDDETLRHLRGLELARAAEAALDGASAQDAAREMKAAIAAIPAYLATERSTSGQADPAAWTSGPALALLEETHADLAARIRAAARVLERYAADPTRLDEAERDGGAPALSSEIDEHAAPSGIWRRFYDRRPAG